MTTVTDDASDILVVRGTSGETWLMTPDGVQLSPVPWTCYRPEIVTVLLDPPEHYWKWLAETATDL